MISEETNNNIRKVLYPFIILFIFVFFCKMIRYPNKNYSLLLILILFGPLFVGAILEIITLFDPKNLLAANIESLLNKFVSLWIICLGLCHYITLKAFKGKYRHFPIKTFTFCALLCCFVITGITTLQFFKESGRDYLLIDLLAILSMGFIAIRMSHFREDIKFGPYSVARESASKLIVFSSIQAFFALLFLIQDVIDEFYHCSSENLPGSIIKFCAVLDLSRLIVYQCWVWFAVFFNWKLGSMNQRTSEEKEITDSLSNSNSNSNSHSSIRSSTRSSTFLPSSRDVF